MLTTVMVRIILPMYLSAQGRDTQSSLVCTRFTLANSFDLFTFLYIPVGTFSTVPGRTGLGNMIQNWPLPERVDTASMSTAPGIRSSMNRRTAAYGRPDMPRRVMGC